MENRIGTCTFRLGILRVFSVAWLLLTLVFIIFFLPENVLSIGILGSLLGVSIGGLGVLKGRSAWVMISLTGTGLVFFMLLLSEIASKTLGQYLPITVLQFVMVLFAVEVLTATCKCQNQIARESFSSKSVGTISSKHIPHSPAERTFRQVSRASLLFASCYLVSLGILYMGSLLASMAPLIADVSLYVVVVSVSLALLLLLRED